MHFVAPARLAESTVPHMVVARAIGGASGRVVMGVVVLQGPALQYTHYSVPGRTC